MTTIFNYRGSDMNDNPVTGFLTKKKIRSSGKVQWAIATGNCSLAETIPISDDFKLLLGIDEDGKYICEGDILDFDSITGEPLSAELAVVLVDKYGKHYYAPKEITWLVGRDSEYKASHKRNSS